MKLHSCKKIHNKKLAEGCKQCVKGRKSVLFITGKCHYNCFYCPISDDKRKDIIKINEHIVSDENAIEELVNEVKLCQSTGVGITGGDPLTVIGRTVKYIEALKKEFGKQFHIHLYTSLEFLTKEKLQQLDSAGLDELRLHPSIEDTKLWEKMKLTTDYSFIVGMEIPALPGKERETQELINYAFEQGIEFTNLNELEYSDTSDTRLTEKNYHVKNALSYGIRGSEELATQLIKKNKNKRIHYCSASFKDATQLGNRLLLRAQIVKQPFDIVDEEGMLTRGEIKGDIKAIYNELQQKDIVLEKERILIAPELLEQLWKDLKKKFPESTAAIVTEYPTDDHFIVEKEIL